MLIKLVQLKRIRNGGPGGEAPSRRKLWGPDDVALSRWAIFCKFLGKKIALLMPFGLHFARFQIHLKEQSFWDLKANWKNPLFTLISDQVQNTFQILHFGVQVCKWLGPGQEKHDTLPSAICLALINTSIDDFA